MKQKTILIEILSLLIFTSNLKGQEINLGNSWTLKPKVACSYTDEQYKISAAGHTDANNYGNFYHLPSIKIRTGMEMKWKIISMYYDMKFWCAADKNHIGEFDPEQVLFEIGGSMKIPHIKYAKIFISHSCLHPLYSDGNQHHAIYGGYTEIGISYGY